MDHDRDGDSRPQGGGVDIGLDEYAVSGFELVITEVLANPSTESTGEFVEVFNAGTGSVDLAGLVLTDGDKDDVLQAFDGGSTVLAAGDYAVIVDSEYDGVYGIDSAVTLLTTGDTNLGNGLTTSDPVTLFEADGSTMIASATHPRDPGEGTSLERVDLETGDVSGNWRESACGDGHSAGAAACFPESGDPAALVITEVMANPDSGTTGEYVEVVNTGTEEIDLAGLVFADSSASDVLVAFDAILLTTEDHAVGSGLSTNDPVTLYEADGTTLVSSFSHPFDPGNGVSVERVDLAGEDTADNWGASGCGLSPGLANCQ